MIVTFINILTLSRILLSIIIFGILALDNLYLLALVLFFIAGMTDYLDGYFARKYNAQSQIGEILDPIADKILIVFLFFGLAVNLSSYLIAFAGAIIVSREILVSALRDFNSRNSNSEATRVTFLAKIKTTIQLFTIMIYLLGLASNKMLIIVLGDICLIISLLVTLYTGYEYLIRSLYKN